MVQGTRLRDFFIYERPVTASKEFSNDKRVVELVSTLRDRDSAKAYYEGKEIQELLFGFDFSVIKKIIEGHNMHFSIKLKKQKQANS
jgi:hypothetical protein